MDPSLMLWTARILSPLSKWDGICTFKKLANSRGWYFFPSIKNVPKRCDYVTAVRKRNIFLQDNVFCDCTFFIHQFRLSTPPYWFLGYTHSLLGVVSVKLRRRRRSMSHWLVRVNIFTLNSHLDGIWTVLMLPYKSRK